MIKIKESMHPVDIFKGTVTETIHNITFCSVVAIATIIKAMVAQCIIYRTKCYVQNLDDNGIITKILEITHGLHIM